MDTIREAVAAGRATIGTWLAIGEGVAAEAMGRAGFDYVCLDGQHGGIDMRNLADTLRAIELGGTQTMVRVPWCSSDQIMRVLDLGAGGVIVPMVSTAEEAAIAAQATHYPPLGIRSFGPVRSYYSADGEKAEPLCFVMIETAEAMENLDAIAATPGLAGLFVGPVDLALSTGLGLSLEMSDQVLEAIDKVVAACAKNDIIPGCAALSPDNARQLVERGMRFVPVGSDVAFLRQGAAEVVALAKELGGG
ncbi:MAG: aldolase/citrate lyase family protein [Novosphingobium sp.]|nr:aldolase/citrate lyase family protein [Novosphingobium sp.]